jgi:hypothetical protein
MREARSAMQEFRKIAQQPSPVVQPQLDGEAVVLHCRYWIDQRAHDPDAVAAELARRLWRTSRLEAEPQSPQRHE